MAVLQCEICGGKLIGKPGGIFECDSCGVEYSTEWCKAKVQEIKGTVKIEGPVQVEGTVTVEGGVNLTALLRRGDLALADGKWNKATEYFDQALNMDAECGHAYFGLTMAELQCGSREKFAELYETNDYAHDKNLQKAKRFPGETQDFLARLDAEIAAELDMDEEERRQAVARLAPIRKRLRPAANLIAAGRDFFVGVKADGTIVVLSDKGHERYVFSDIIAVAAKGRHNVVLKADGTVVATRDNKYKQCEVSEWKNITAIAAGNYHTVGLRADGTVLQTGEYHDNLESFAAVSNWRNVTAIAAGSGYTAALKADGTVAVAICQKGLQFNHVSIQFNHVSSWRDIVGIAAGSKHIVGLKSDGTVVADGNNEYGQCNVSRWYDIVAIDAGSYHTVGLKADGTVVAVGYDGGYGACRHVSRYKNIVAVAAGFWYNVFLKEDGTAEAFGHIVGSEGQYPVGNWKLFDSLESLAQERAEAAARRKAEIEAEQRRREEEAEQRRLAEERRLEAEHQEVERQKKISKLRLERRDLQIELANLKGLFSGGRRKELEAKLAQIENDLKGLN